MYDKTLMEYRWAEQAKLWTQHMFLGPPFCRHSFLPLDFYLRKHVHIIAARRGGRLFTHRMHVTDRIFTLVRRRTYLETKSRGLLEKTQNCAGIIYREVRISIHFNEEVDVTAYTADSRPVPYIGNAVVSLTLLLTIFK